MHFSTPFFYATGYLLSFFAYFFAGAFFVSFPPFFCAFAASYYSSFFLFCYSAAASFVSNYMRFLDIISVSFSSGLRKRGWATASHLKTFEFFNISFFFDDHNGSKSTKVPPMHYTFIFIYFLSSKTTFC